MKLIQREQYLAKLRALRDKAIIKVITGVRRCGKSTLMQLFQKELLQSGVSEKQIISINFEDYDFVGLRNAKALYQHVVARLVEGVTNYVFLDEIQHVDNYADVVDALFVKENVDLYITGSNAYLLSSEIATLLSGRYVELQLLPLSFKEYVNATGNTNDLERKYADYITFSSFPYAMAFDKEVQMTNDYLRGIYSTIVLKDVMHRHSIGDAMMLENVMAFMADNIGNTLSVKKIADTLTSSGRKVDVKTIEKYLSALCQSFILYPAKRFNIKGRQLLKTMEKYYLVDVALRNTLLGSTNADFGRILENVVYLELLRRYPNVYIGKTDAFEIDFVAVNMQEVAYYQVAATVRDEATLERELHPLKMVKDNYPKTILSLDVAPVAYHNGIKIQNVLDWLLEQ
ncbi:MAG: ATP-binding protein [Bacteroidales bacterium]|nr:ATP-binding protein [Bacteroidales bacterium]